MRRVYVEEASQVARELYLGMVVDRKAEAVSVIASTEGGMEIEEVAAKTPGEDPHRPDRSAARDGAVSGAPNSVRAGAERQAGGPVRHAARRALPRVRRDRRLADRNQSAGGDHRRPRDLPRRQNVVRRQRAVPPSRHPRAARRQRGGSGRDRGRQVRPQLRASRRQHRMHGQRRGPRDGDDGHREVLRRRAGQLPRRRRRREFAERSRPPFASCSPTSASRRC